MKLKLVNIYNSICAYSLCTARTWTLAVQKTAGWGEPLSYPTPPTPQYVAVVWAMMCGFLKQEF